VGGDLVSTASLTPPSGLQSPSRKWRVENRWEGKPEKGAPDSGPRKIRRGDNSDKGSNKALAVRSALTVKVVLSHGDENRGRKEPVYCDTERVTKG